MLTRAAALATLALLAGCSSGSSPAAAQKTAAPSPTVASKPGCTPIGETTKTAIARGAKPGVMGLALTDGYVVKGPNTGLQSYVLAAHVTATGQPPNQVAVWAAFTEQPGDADDALILAVNPVAKALTTWYDSLKNDQGLTVKSAGVAEAVACLS